MKEKKENTEYIQQRSNDILDVIMAYARLEFNEKIEIKSEDDVFDSIAAGVNMLGEELENSVVTINEKEALLKEVHHRVKNNLQIISSLMNLQASNTTDPVFLSLIRECKNRIASMSMIHEMLYQSKNLSSISTEEYIRHLVLSIESSFCLADLKVRFDFHLEKGLLLETDKMIPIGLILNEAISNSFKHAFPGKNGTISIHLEKINGLHKLTIADNGTGIHNDRWRTGTTLGIQLIHTLAEQLDAKMEMIHKDGVTYIFEFE
jgi:two-component sensor histidine kinase